MFRRLVVFTVIAAACLAAPASADAVWTRPVPGRVVRPFEPPRTRYGPGHLGVDLAAAPGTRVRAAGSGTVVFAGAVADALHVVVRHPGNLRTSYSFLATVAVHSGDRVVRGEVLGTTGGRGEGHRGLVLHLGLRVRDTYVDPMQLFAPTDLSARVHLAPLDEQPSPASPIRSAGLAPAPVGLVEWCIRPGGSTIRTA